MAIGAHELLLIVRAQNQASALLGRVGRDVRRLQGMRDAALQRQAILSRLARADIQQQARLGQIQSVMLAGGKARLAHEQAVARNLLQQQNVQDRIANLEIRRTGVVRAEAGLEVQRLRLLQQEVTAEANLEKIELRRRGINAQIGRMGTQLQRNALQQQQLRRQAFALDTQLMERELALQKARSREMSAVSRGVSGSGLAQLTAQRQIAQRRVQETVMSIGELPGRGRILQSAAQDIRNNIGLAQRQIEGLAIAEKQAAASANILAQRHEVLSAQYANVAARAKAVDYANAELNSQLKILERQLQITNAQWQETVAETTRAQQAYAATAREIEVMNQQLAENAALMRRQGFERLQTTAGFLSHIGRVATGMGLITAAAFGAMGVAAAHFNVEATRAATQTGKIGSNANVVVANASRIEKAIINLMHAVPANQDDLTNSLYYIYSTMNTTFGQGTRLLKIFAQTWEAGGMVGSVEDTSQALVTLANNWHIAASNMNAFRKLAASTLATVRFGGLTVQQYTQTMNQLAPAFHGAGQSIDQMNASIAFMTTLLPSQRFAATGLARLMESLQKLAAAPKPGFEKLAKDITDASGNLKPLNQVIDIIVKAYPKITKSGIALQQFWKEATGQTATAQTRRAFQALIRNPEQYRRILALVTGDQNEFNRSLRAMERSTGVRWAQFVNDMKAFGLEIGTIVLPGLLKLAGALQGVAKWFHNLSPEARHNIATWGAIAAAVTLVSGVVLTVVGSIARSILAIRALTAESKSLSAIFGLSGRNAGILAGEVGSAGTKFGIAAGAATILLALLIKYPHQVHEVVNQLGGLKRILEVITAIMIGRQLQRGIGYVALIGTTAEEAAAGVGILRGALLNLQSAVPWLTAIAALLILTRKLADQRRQERPGEKPLVNLSGVPVLGWLQKQASNALLGGQQAGENFGKAFTRAVDRWIDKDLVRSKAKVSQMTSEAIKTATSPEGMSRTQAILQQHAIAASNAIPSYVKLEAQTDLLKGNWADIDRIFRTYVDMIPQAVSGTAQLADAAKKVMEVTISDTQAIAMQRNIENLQKAFAKAPSPANYKAYQRAIKNLAKVGSKDQVAMAQAVVSAQDDLQQQAIQEAKDAAAKRKQILQQEVQDANQAFQQAKQRSDQAQSDIKSAVSSIMNVYQTSLQQYQQQLGTLFQGPWMTGSFMQDRQQFGFFAKPSDLLKDLQMSVGHFQRFQATINRLRRRGAPEELINQIQQLGPEAQKQMDTLLKLTPGQFKQYVALFQRGQREAQNLAEADAKRQLKKWERFGKNVALAIATGIRSENVALENAMTALIRKAFPGLVARAVPPQRTPRRRPGESYQDYLNRVRGYRPTPTRSTQSAGGTTNHNNQRYETVHYNIAPSYEGEALEAKLRRAHFINKNRNRNR